MTFVGDPPDGSFEERLGHELVELHRERLSARLTPQIGRVRNLRRVLVIVGAALIVFATSLGLVLTHVVIPPPRPATSTQTPATVRANLDAALVAAGDDVIVIRRTLTSASECVATSWITPFDVQIGDSFREVTTSTCRDGSRSGTGLYFSVRSTAHPSVLHPYGYADLQQFVCGLGTEVGYDTSENESWSESGQTLRIAVPATPNLLGQAVSGNDLRVIGSGTVDGQKAIALSLAEPKENTGTVIVLWISRLTYLPIRETQTLSNGSSRPPDVLEQDFSFLPPTPGNLALTRLTVPSNLRAVANPGAFEVSSCAY
jgi:hypothetical protein